MSRPTKLRFLGEKIGSSRDGPRQQSPLSLPLLPFRTGRHSAAESWGGAARDRSRHPGSLPSRCQGHACPSRESIRAIPRHCYMSPEQVGRGKGYRQIDSHPYSSHLPTQGRDASWGFLARQPGWPSEGLEPSVLGRGAGAGSSCIKTRLVT